MARKAKITAEAVIDALLVWMAKEKLEPKTAGLVNADGSLWVEFLDVELTFPPGEPPTPYLRALLAKRMPNDLGEPLAREVLILELFDSPAAVVTEGTDFIQRDLAIPRRVAIYATSEGVIADDCYYIREDWGATALWPFPD